MGAPVALALDVHAVAAHPGFDLDARLVAGPGEVVALVGPNGSGKTTLLRAVLQQRPDAGIVFQDLLLFPHLSVLDNVAFGLRRQRLRRAAARAQARQWLERFGVAELAERRPAGLSGGQAARVALARALATRPGVLLLDEPFAAVDVAGRAEVRRALRTALAEHGGPCVLVTHQPVEVLALASRVVVLEGGRVVQDGPVAELRARPRSRWVAELAGVNLLPAEAVVVPSASEGWAVFHPHAVTLSRARPDTSARNVWEGSVLDVDLEGERARVRVACPPGEVVAEVTVGALADLALSPGTVVWASVKATEITVYPA